MNVGNLDAIIRAIVGWALIHLQPVLKVQMSKPLKVILLIIGLILVITAITRYCALYELFNISTL